MSSSRPWISVLERWKHWVLLFGWYPYRMPHSSVRVRFKCFVSAMLKLHEVWALGEDHLLALWNVTQTPQHKGQNPWLSIEAIEKMIEMGLISEESEILTVEPCLQVVTRNMVGGIDDCFIYDPPLRLCRS